MSDKNNKNNKIKTSFNHKFKVPVVKIVDGKPVNEFIYMSEAEIDEMSKTAENGMKGFLGDELYDDMQEYKAAKEKLESKE